MALRTKIFISHATPADNDFTKWLSLKLIALGYDVWCDLFYLEKGTDFWNSIETEIRENTCKFLIVQSVISNKSDGVLKELAVAAKVKKQQQDEAFIIPLAIDNKLSYDDINIELVRLNSIDFKTSWAKGLQDLIEALEKQNVPKNAPDLNKSNLLYQQIFLQGKSIIDKEEIYDSNWFPIISFPEELRFHKYEWLLPKDFDVRTLTFPAVRYKDYLCTFAWEYDFMHQLPKTETYDNKNTIRISVADIFSNTYDSKFISNSECQRLIVQLINKGFELRMKDKNVREYQMSNKSGYWIEKGKLEKDKFNKVQFVGKMLEKNWHFGISAAAKLYPYHTLMISSHIYFTKDGIILIESKNQQHAARRKQGAKWWNNDWRTKLLGFVKYISDDENSFYLEMGSEEKITISNQPMQFVGKVSYDIPNVKNLEEESELSDLTDIDDFEEVEEGKE
ncbi:TIR domain-containing protein [Bacteroidia bacterium]|nr:TIR domain-containing protein [Bacteroidia bacterium]